MSSNTPLLAATRAVQKLASTQPETACFILHPVEVADWLDHRLPQHGAYVLEKVGGPALPLWDWIEAQLASPRLPGKATLQQSVDSFRREFPG